MLTQAIKNGIVEREWGRKTYCLYLGLIQKTGRRNDLPDDDRDLKQLKLDAIVTENPQFRHKDEF